ncbi:unnamed protein product, partial [Adineta ricciae]
MLIRQSFLLLISIIIVFINAKPLDFQDSFGNEDDDDAYYDGDQNGAVRVNLFQTLDCSIQCPPHWIEPVLQQRQTLVYPTSASVSLKCPYEAKPKAKITWFKDGQLFLPELYELFSIDHQFLNISKATMYEAGLYTCVVENSLGNISRAFQLIVQGRSLDRPVFISKSSNLTKYESDNVTFECLFYSDSSPFVQWFVQRQAIKQGSQTYQHNELEFIK